MSPERTIASTGRGSLHRAVRPSLLLVLVGVLPGLAACGGEGPVRGGERAIDRDTFVTAYVDLRVQALQGDADELTEASRERVLREHGVAQEDLLRFVEVHGRDVEFMRGVWADARRRIIEIDEEMLAEARATRRGDP